AARTVGAGRARGRACARARRRTTGPHLQSRPRRHARHEPRRSRPARLARPRADGEGHRMSTAVIVMAYGSPPSEEDVPAYLADIREGKPVSEHAVEELKER